MSRLDAYMLDEAVRADFQTFLHRTFVELNGRQSFHTNWHLRAIEQHLGATEKGGARLIINMPPRSLKSITVSVAYTAWRLGHDPRLRFVCVSYAQDLSLKLARDCRQIMLSSGYRRAFPETVLARAVEGELETTAGGGRYSTSIGGVLTGRGGDVIIIDDPTKPADALSAGERAKAIEWFGSTLQSRLDDKVKGSIVVVMQRLHEEDLSGHLLAGGRWALLSLPATAERDEVIPLGRGEVHHCREGDLLQPDREPREKLDQLKADMGSAAFSAQYQQAPVPAGGVLVERAWLRRYARAPERQQGDQVVQSWDCASKDGVMNDHSACITALIRKQEVFILDVWRGRVQMPELLRRVTSLAHAWGAQIVLIEDAASGTALLQILKHDQPRGVPRPISIQPGLDKITRLAGVCPRLEAGQVLLPDEAPWLADFERELLGFPNTRHDDQVDALSQLLNWQNSRRRRDDIPCGAIVFTLNEETDQMEVDGDPYWASRLGDLDEDPTAHHRW